MLLLSGGISKFGKSSVHHWWTPPLKKEEYPAPMRGFYIQENQPAW